MRLFCLDLEGVLVPEIWIQTAKRFKMDSLKLTTRDIPDYDKLMKYRIRILKKAGIRLKDIQKVIATMQPLPGAQNFLDQLRQEGPVIILSDTFVEFAAPLMEKLGQPVLLCNHLVVDKKGFIAGYKLRMKDGKRKAVEAFRKLNFEVCAAGDSYNDITMLKAARRGVLFRPPKSIRKKFRRFPAVNQQSALLQLLIKT